MSCLIWIYTVCKFNNVFIVLFDALTVNLGVGGGGGGNDLLMYFLVVFSVL